MNPIEQKIEEKTRNIPNFMIKQKKVKSQGVRFRLHTDGDLIIERGTNSTYGYTKVIRLYPEQTAILFEMLKKRDKIKLMLHELLQDE